MVTRLETANKKGFHITGPASHPTTKASSTQNLSQEVDFFRIVEIYSRRFQVQERLTREIAKVSSVHTNKAP